ncbi:TPA: MurR/RpiR family transcriptional regulator [Streptococcus equi subsp. zooepidemicus]|uniref:MurR/RpiR family transcriptional regulator n=1 Tax=Streptococcus equi TaxID=1336 RepID=UPI0019800B6B|nr:SIS domain-containing protein [Streptococcus equi]MCD3408006.1 SIS domain-containing protein [Streptococcus equi subsp. zooepidemicus]MDI5900826.1 SIS domain-containing protein [Streptococcus equi subsp. zooepidemicus]MDI5918689.1 SIS domain-containing protein [Streptococcus equi subsp. zooepidemicus]MDI5946655.1 SIS domain-containing protein [Streptococcus equi subsp. zooepidemicus]MDI5956785.1 SIS domain-containing protein [Streptococcus equi subsp. zooepidemicus]
MSPIYHPNRLFPNNSFYPEDGKLIESIIRMIETGENLDIRHIAEINYTSPSSISRLAKRAGFSHFKEFIFFLSTTSQQKNKSQLANLPFARTDSDWEAIGNQLRHAFTEKKIFLFGEGFCQFLVAYTYRKLLLKKIYPVNLDGVEISTVSDDTPHTLITFSHSGENKRGLIKIDECKQRDGCVIAITASSNSSYHQRSDHCIIVESHTIATDYENQHLNFFFGNSLNLVEYLIDQFTN